MWSSLGDNLMTIPMNPHLDIDKQLQMLPRNHPAREESFLTPLQSTILPGLLWLFDPDRNRGQGKTYLIAVTMIELAIRGYIINVEDYSQSLTNRESIRSDQYLMEMIEKIMHVHYPRLSYEYKMSTKQFKITGMRPK
jgi:hypothetical protein